GGVGGRVVALGRSARDQAKLKLRQPLRAVVVEGVTVDEAHGAEIADELRVKQVRFERVDTTGLRVKPNFPVLAPRLGSSLPLVKKALDGGEFAELDGGRFEVMGHILEPTEVLVRRVEKDGCGGGGDGGGSWAPT